MIRLFLPVSFISPVSNLFLKVAWNRRSAKLTAIVIFSFSVLDFSTMAISPVRIDILMNGWDW